MVFWKLHAKSGMSYEQVAKHSFHISRAVLDLESNIEGKTSISIEVQDEETVICHLSASYDQAPLDLNFEKGEHLRIIIHGNSDVHLSGYTLNKEKEVTFNESTEEISKKRKKKTNKDKNILSSPKQENGLMHKIKSEQIESSEQKLSKESKKMKVKENGAPFCILNDSSSKKKAKTEKKSAEKLSDLLSKSYDEEEDDEDEEYIIDEDDNLEEEGEEEDEDEDMEEDYDEDAKEDDEDEDDEDDDDKEADDEDDKEDDEEDDKEAIDISNGDLEEDKDFFSEVSPEKKKRPLSPPSSAGRTPMIRSSKKAKKQKMMSSPELTPVPLKQKKQKVIDSPAEKEIKTPQSGLKKEIRKGGLLCEDIKVGTGKEAKIGKNLAVYYEGKLKKNGYTFDKLRSGPGFNFKLGTKDIIEAWNVGIVGMKVGGKRKLVVPPNMAYGKGGNPPEIPPNAFLSFEIELKSVL